MKVYVALGNRVSNYLVATVIELPFARDKGRRGDMIHSMQKKELLQISVDRGF